MNQDVEFLDDFSPLMENVVQRDYTKPSVDVPNDFTPIDEPMFTQPSFDEINETYQNSLNGGESATNESGGQGGSDFGGGDFGSANPSMEQLDSKDQRVAAKAMVEAVLDGYTQLNRFGNKLVQFSPDKVDEMMRNGEIDPNISLPIDGQNVGIGEYINEYNKQVGDVISVSEEFKNKVRPVMTRVFMKRGIGMTDEQLLMYYFGIDIITKGAMIVGLRKQNANLIENLKQITSEGATAPKPEPKKKKEKPVEKQYVEPTDEGYDTGREYVEPEEVKQKPVEDFVDAEVIVERPVKPKTSSMPEFGDSDILSHMEEVAQGGDPSRKRRGRPKKS